MRALAYHPRIRRDGAGPSRLANSATRRVSELNSIALRKAISRLVIGLVHGKVTHRHVELDAIVERDELLRQPRLLGIVDQGLAALVLLDLDPRA